MMRKMSLALGLALVVSQSALAEDAADRAVAAAQQYSGTTLSLHTEAGLQALGWELYNAKKWEELTGIKIEITSAPVNEASTLTFSSRSILARSAVLLIGHTPYFFTTLGAATHRALVRAAFG